MKKVFFFLLAAVAFTACENTNLYDEEAAAKIKYENQVMAYTQAFVEQFGKPAMDQNWGFGDLTVVSTSRGSDPNSTQWWKYVDVPEKLTDEQIQVVTEWFSTHQNPEGTAIDYSDYFIQQVSSTAHGKSNMDQLRDGLGHDYNFNAGDAGVMPVYRYNGDPNNGVWDHDDKIMLVTESSTAYFGYHNSYDEVWRNDDFVIIPGSIISPIVAGMYFVGFDYQHYKVNASEYDVVEKDGYFNDWIVKVTPGDFKDRARVMCEDLGTTDDFDFNDVVFDVKITGWYGNYTAEITLQAAGGTMPLYIEDKEVHELFGVDTNTMVNTGAGAVTKAPVTFTVPARSTNPNDIVVKVSSTEAGVYELQSQVGSAPQKICVPTRVKHSAERVMISETYPSFAQWAQKAKKTFWDE